MQKLLSSYPVDRISQIGGTAVQGIWVKDIVDVMVELPDTVDIKDLARLMEQSGFIKMPTEGKRISLNKSYTKEVFADRVFHIYLRYTGDNDELYFWD